MSAFFDGISIIFTIVLRERRKKTLGKSQWNSKRLRNLVWWSFLLHPGKWTWNLEITPLKREIIFQTSMIVFHVNFPGCTKQETYIFMECNPAGTEKHHIFGWGFATESYSYSSPFRISQKFKLENMVSQIVSKDIPSLKLTVRTWKWMVGILVAFWNGLFSGAMLVSGRVCSCGICLHVAVIPPNLIPTSQWNSGTSIEGSKVLLRWLEPSILIS